MSRYLGRAVLLLACPLVLATGAACSRGDSAPPVATVSLTSNKLRVPLGGPVDLTYRFDVAPTAPPIQGDYKVLVHVNQADGTRLWADDFAPAPPTSTWKPGQKIEETRTLFVPVVPYIGEATIMMGLYKDNDRLPLQGANPADRKSTAREYKVGTLQLLPSSDKILVIKSSGWHPTEFAPEDAATSWAWTQKSAAFSFTNPRTDVTIFLEYDARPDVFPDQPQKATLYSGDQVVKTLTAASNGRTLERILVTAAQLGTRDMAQLRLDIDRTFVPAQLPAGGKDMRELGIRVYQLYVEGR